MAKAKGTTLIGAVKALRSKKAEATEILPTELQHYLTERISTATWYPEEHLLGLIRALVQLIPGDADEVLEAMGVATARALGEGIYSHLISNGGSASGTFALWASMHDTGQLRMTRESKSSLRFELADYACPSPEMCTIIGAYIGETLRIGGQVVRMEKLGCVLSGAVSCTWRASW